MMNILENLTSSESKSKWRKLVFKYHPDRGGDIRTAQRINAAKDKGDDAVDRLYDELVLGKKFGTEKNSSERSDQSSKENYKDFTDARAKYEEFMKKRREEREAEFADAEPETYARAVQNLKMVKGWVEKPDFVKLFRDFHLDYDFEVVRGNDKDVDAQLQMYIDQRAGGKKFIIKNVGEGKLDRPDKLYDYIFNEMGGVKGTTSNKADEAKQTNYSKTDGINREDASSIVMFSQMKQWLLQPRFMNMINENHGICELKKDDKDEKYPVILTIKAISGSKKLSESYHLKLTIEEDKLFKLIKDVLEYWYNGITK